MITKNHLLDACRHETKVVKHLATKIPEGTLDWRPTDGQRSTLELMRYMTVMAEMMAINAVTGDWEHAHGKWRHPYYWAGWALWGLPD